MTDLYNTEVAFEPLKTLVEKLESLNQVKLRYGKGSEIRVARKTLEEIKHKCMELKKELNERRKNRNTIFKEELLTINRLEREADKEVVQKVGAETSPTQDEDVSYIDELYEDEISAEETPIADDNEESQPVV
jgi:hypothetical protein